MKKKKSWLWQKLATLSLRVVKEPKIRIEALVEDEVLS
jgi:hypothetical protein